VSASIMDSFNNEAIALAAVGSTLLVASGDDGISGHSCDCTVDSSSSTLTYAAAGGAVYSGQGYFPSFPATNPYGMALLLCNQSSTIGLVAHRLIVR
jgi:subtilase family serine protease